MLTTRCLKCNVTIEVTGGTAPPKKDEFVMVASDSHDAAASRDPKEVTANSLQSKAKKIEREDILGHVRVINSRVISPGSVIGGQYGKVTVGSFLDSSSRTTPGLISVAHGDTELEGAQGVCDVCVTKIINEAKRKVAATKEKKRAIEAALRRLNDEEADCKVRSGSNIESLPGSGIGSGMVSIGPDETSSKRLPAVSLDEMSNDEIMRKVAIQEDKLMRELSLLKQEEEELKEESYQIDEEMRDMDEAEQRFWSDEFADFQAALMDCEDQKAQSAVLLSYAKNQLQRLKRTNALNDVFYISSHGPFGCINNYRLGRLPENSPAVVGGIGSAVGSGGSTLIGAGNGGREGIGSSGTHAGNVVSNVGHAVGGVVSNVVGGVGGVVSDVVGGVGVGFQLEIWKVLTASDTVNLVSRARETCRALILCVKLLPIYVRETVFFPQCYFPVNIQFFSSPKFCLNAKLKNSRYLVL